MSFFTSKGFRTFVHILTVGASILTAISAVPGPIGVDATAALAVISGILHFFGAESSAPAK